MFTRKKEKLRIGDTVRRKGDSSGRTRVVTSVTMGGVVELDEKLDGWLIWDASKLELVARTVTPAIPCPARNVHAK